MASGTPNAFLGANRWGWHSFGYFSFAIERKVTRRQGETGDTNPCTKVASEIENPKEHLLTAEPEP
jgi:hypothetical protein